MPLFGGLTVASLALEIEGGGDEKEGKGEGSRITVLYSLCQPQLLGPAQE